MDRNDIVRMAREAGAYEPTNEDDWAFELVDLERFAALVAAAEREAAISKIENEICHAEINNLRLTPLFGQRHGPLAVRVDSLEAVIDAIRARSDK